VVAARTLNPADLEGGNLRTPAAAQAASVVAVNPDVRRELVEFQRKFALRPGGAVLDGRDIGTVICPDAEVKLFITASAECRATRRYKELSEKGLNVTPEGVLADVKTRDSRDQNRATAPLIAAVDAVLIDTSDLTIPQAVARAVAVVESAQKPVG